MDNFALPVFSEGKKTLPEPYIRTFSRKAHVNECYISVS